MLRTFLLILSAILIVIGFGPFVYAQDASTLTVEHAYAYATAEGAKNGAAFMTLKNRGADKDILTGASADGAGLTQIHENFIDMENGRMMMRQIPLITIPAQDKAVLEPKGRHIMLMGLKQPLKEGETLSLTLTFDKAGTIVVPVSIVAPGSDPANNTKTPPAADVMDTDEGSADHSDHSHHH